MLANLKSSVMYYGPAENLKYMERNLIFARSVYMTGVFLLLTELVGQRSGVLHGFFASFVGRFQFVETFVKFGLENQID
uniref:Uncharacterized protein n=1 Tax=Romanomermis culicivorax TaxID=13658 RepID=A0A915I5Z0_ROMCU